MPGSFIDTISGYWLSPVFEIGGNSISVGKIIASVILLLIGLLLSSELSKRIGNNLLKKFNVVLHIRTTIQNVVYYICILITILFVLQFIEIPIESLAMFGGALAIGLGFGLRNLVNNFLSGIILILERPVRTGDFIEVEGLLGTVEDIGFRATKVKSVDNSHIIIPNSTLLEHKVLNWTLSDDIVRTMVRVGVAYGADTNRVRDVLKVSTEEHGKILKNPKPNILFTDFGDNALIFEIYFWSRIRNRLELRNIESDLRYIMNKKFQSQNIVISFPQRDIHIDSPAPIRVEMVQPVVKEESEDGPNLPGGGK